MAFVDTEARPTGEVQQKVGRISEAIREGAEEITDNRQRYLYKGCGCALGAAYYARTGEKTASYSGVPEYWFASKLGIDRELACIISARHARGESRESIATWLESQGL